MKNIQKEATALASACGLVVAVVGSRSVTSCGALVRRLDALHALGLGFIFSMIMGHAPVILPAVARVKLRFGVWFYAPLAALHLSLVVRLGFGLLDLQVRGTGALLNAAAIALFAVTIVGSAVAWHFRPRVQPAGGVG